MARVIAGDRVGKFGRLAVGCSATIFDATHEHVLLARRADNGRWCVPGGYMEPGESTTEACIREVWEETGLQVRVVRLIGVYTNPHLLLEYPDGNRWQLVVLHFEAAPIGGELGISDETTEMEYFSRAEVEHLDMSPLDRLRTTDAFAAHSTVVVRDAF